MVQADWIGPRATENSLFQKIRISWRPYRLRTNHLELDGSNVGKREMKLRMRRRPEKVSST